jgi:hypothetical protein
MSAHGQVASSPRVARGGQLAAAAPTVLYVGGFGRSGTTLVGRVLGEMPNALCVGEIRYVWSRGLMQDVLCGCGQPFRSCSFWTAVGDAAFGGWEKVDVARLADIDRNVLPLRRFPSHWVPPLRPKLVADAREYAHSFGKLYAAIAAVSGARIVVDTSKDPNFALILQRMSAYDIRVVHLVRDSRAVAYSWTRLKRLPTPIDNEEFMGRFKPVNIAASWLACNAALGTLAISGRPYVKIKYEDFIGNPSHALRELGAFAGTSCPPAARLADNKVMLGDHHIFSGNPMRVATGWLEMRVDNEWETMMPTSQVSKVTAITWPQLASYGYPIVPRAARS